ncbi:hypothetical protein Celaphus_00014816, partial [Cervus elaphus hippelaphus]
MAPSSPLQRAAQEPYQRPEEQVLINRRDITSRKDAWDMQEFIKRMYVKQLLRHPASKKHYELFSTIDDIVLTTLICELLLGWLNGFWIFWKDGWNILNFLIIFILLLGFFVSELNAVAITYTLRALRLLHLCMAVEPLARIIRVILQSVPDMANIMTLILFFMLVFSVFGVTLFGVFVPKHFQNMQVALYTLFICITQDGWQMMKAEQGQQHQIDFSEVDDKEGNGNNKLPLVHCAVARSEMPGVPQEPFMGGPLTNLSERTCDNFCLVRSIRFNQEQEEELLQRCLSWNMSLESKSSVDIREMTREQDLITALVNRKKVQLLSFPLLPNQCSPPTSPSPATTPLVKVSDSVKVWPAPLGSQAPQQSPPI